MKMIKTRPRNASSTDTPDASASSDPAAIRASIDKLVDEGKKAIALSQWEEAVERYGEALELQQELVGDKDPQMAPLLLSYGRALYELASSQAGVMGREEPTPVADEAGPSGEQNPNFVFSADPASDDEGDDAADPEPEASGSAPGPSDPSAEAAEGEAADDIGELEDDYNAAWEVLDVARKIYEEIVSTLKEGEGEKERLALADCHQTLGDVSCETEKFPQAVEDFTTALTIKSALLPPSSRALASLHYQIATALENIPSKRTSALSHVQAAIHAFQLRKAQLSGPPTSDQPAEVGKLSEKEKKNELEEVELLIGDLEAKVEELKSTPEAAQEVHESINLLMGQSEGGGVKVDNGPVNDLTGMVKKKKPKAAPARPAPAPAPAADAPVVGGEKRAAEGGEEPAAKKAKPDEA
ncbi:hypothetical protein B9479_005170 [Cryptococcus floricola]|uniref:Tetratricopeptide SHNi-TPR domain-containing protein n=1 Tax=Cryptococcus floricola TaxID=2591691 RepID=A0A5D3AVA0_9TREE|nr:hypothetical protein B9479_005170 [Cryptococcus floricola]